MAEKYFPDDPVKEYRELKGGTFNVAYELQLCSGKTVILKVAPGKIGTGYGFREKYYGNRGLGHGAGRDEPFDPCGQSSGI